MCNQDDVALRLIRNNPHDMHEIMYNRGIYECRSAAWEDIINLESTVKLLLSHGWTLDAYIAECKRYVIQEEPRSILTYMCCKFSNTPYA